MKTDYVRKTGFAVNSVRTKNVIDCNREGGNEKSNVRSNSRPK